MTAGTALPVPGTTGVWQGVCARLGAAVSALAGRSVRVHPLGVADESASVTHEQRAGATVLLTGTAVLVGARTGPGCSHCLARRWQAAQGSPVLGAITLGGASTGGEGPPADLAFVAAAVAALLDNVAAGRAVALDLATLCPHEVEVLPDPHCPACGVGDAGVPRPELRLVASPKRTEGFRARSVSDYDLPVGALVNPVCGAIGRGTLTELALPSTASVWGHFATRTLDEMYEIHWGGHANGYGTSLAIGLLEGLERYAGMTPRAVDDRRRASVAELAAERVDHLDPRACGLYGEEFYPVADAIVPFTTDLRIPWITGWSLRDHRALLVPEIVSYYHAAVAEERFVQECSNGCASGSSLTEAVWCGLLELIERDAFLLAWYGRITLPELDGRSSARPETRTMIERLALYGYRARFFDARMSFGVPVVVGAAERVDGGLGALSVGAGCGLDPEDALASALDEIATDALNQRRRVEQDEPRLRALAADFTRIESIHDHPIVFGLPEMARHADFLLAPVRPVQTLTEAYPNPALPPSNDLRDDLTALVDLLAAHGFDVVVVDQTTPEQRRFGVHTASVIVPGLLPLDFGWDRQRALHMPRLRSAPHEAGHTARDLTDADLHRVPHPFP